MRRVHFNGEFHVCGTLEVPEYGASRPGLNERFPVIPYEFSTLVTQEHVGDPNLEGSSKAGMNMDSTTDEIRRAAPLAEADSRSLAFWLAPADALFRPDVVSATFGYQVGYLAKLRSQGGGPRYRKAGKLVWYRKSDFLSWFEQVTVEAENTGEAAANHRARQ